MRWRSFRPAQVDVGPADDGARFAGAFDPREEPDRVVEQGGGGGMREQLGPDEPEDRWPVTSGVDQTSADDPRRFQ
jgi:hypothetical protein